jgi:2-polyprenyl-6-methoxyphenol hydroxylase-like FAD-dependent oxidoreductase
MPIRPFRHAVVAGGGMAGLLAARVLADHFEHVTLVERDLLGRSPEPRKGVPQGRHGHALLPRGQEIMEGLFPGLAAELCAAEAIHVSATQQFAWHHAGDWRARIDTDLSFLAMSRPLLETTIANRARTLPNVVILDGTRVEGPRLSQQHVITGLQICHVSGRNIHQMEADLVVDATGRGSAVPQWLKELQLEPPPVDRIAAPITYASCTFRRSDPLPEWRSLVITGAPARRTGFIFAIEGQRWLVSLGGFFDEPVPQSHQDFLAFARSLGVPDLHEAIRRSEPASEVVHYRFAGSLRHRYERLSRFPEGLIVLGDAVCSLNPIYGQGMTVSAIEAETLHQALAWARQKGGIDSAFSRHWFRSIQPTIDVAWDSVLVEDYRFPELVGRRPYRIRPLQWYVNRVHRATHRSPVVTDQFYRVVNFLAPPTSLFHPRILARVLSRHGS